MAKTFFQVLIFTIFILTACYCQERKAIYNPQAIRLNNKAVEFIKIQNFDSALNYLNKAIEIDTTYYVAYGNRCSVYCSLKDFKKALVETQKEILVKPDLAEAWTFAGMLSDKLGDTLNATKYYKKSIEIFDDRISNPDKEKYLELNRLNRAISLILMGQKEIGRNEIKKIKAANPNDKSLDDFFNLEKKDYLSHILND